MKNALHDKYGRNLYMSCPHVSIIEKLETSSHNVPEIYKYYYDSYRRALEIFGLKTLNDNGNQLDQYVDREEIISESFKCVVQEMTSVNCVPGAFIHCYDSVPVSSSAPEYAILIKNGLKNTLPISLYGLDGFEFYQALDIIMSSEELTMENVLVSVSHLLLPSDSANILIKYPFYNSVASFAISKDYKINHSNFLIKDYDYCSIDNMTNKPNGSLLEVDALISKAQVILKINTSINQAELLINGDRVNLPEFDIWCNCGVIAALIFIWKYENIFTSNIRDILFITINEKSYVSYLVLEHL